MIKSSITWALIADITPNVSKYEEVSFCVRVLSKLGNVCEYLLFCTCALSMTAEQLINDIVYELERLAV